MSKTSLRFERRDFEMRIHNFVNNLGFSPKNWDNFYLAFVHRSVLNESSKTYTESNERLEFLGDAVLELTITEQLFHDFPNKSEGELTDIRSAVVRGRNLAIVASRLGMSEILQLSRGEVRVDGHQNPYILANAVEAFLGAIYLEFGIEIAREFVMREIYSSLTEIMNRGLFVDPKSFLQEISQSVWGVLPEYRIISETGQDHNKKYTIAVFLGNDMVGEGVGTSKKKGEQDAAENAIAARESWEGIIKISKKIA